MNGVPERGVREGVEVPVTTLPLERTEEAEPEEPGAAVDGGIDLDVSVVMSVVVLEGEVVVIRGGGGSGGRGFESIFELTDQR